jgi:hypothetical protein
MRDTGKHLVYQHTKGVNVDRHLRRGDSWQIPVTLVDDQFRSHVVRCPSRIARAGRPERSRGAANTCKTKIRQTGSILVINEDIILSYEM